MPTARSITKPVPRSMAAISAWEYSYLWSGSMKASCCSRVSRRFGVSRARTPPGRSTRRTCDRTLTAWRLVTCSMLWPLYTRSNDPDGSELRSVMEW